MDKLSGTNAPLIKLNDSHSSMIALHEPTEMIRAPFLDSNPLCEVFYAVPLLKDTALKSARI